MPLPADLPQEPATAVEPGSLPQEPATVVEPAGRPLLPPATSTRAMGMLMAAAPCSAGEARRILATAADLAGVTVHDLAAAVAVGPGGTPSPVHVERALRRAVAAAHTSTAAAALSVGLAPSRERTEEVLTRLRGCQARLAAAPEDPAAVRAMDDVAYTICVLMGRPTTHSAVLAAERHLAAPASRRPRTPDGPGGKEGMAAGDAATVEPEGMAAGDEGIRA
ncbi:DUF5133 domain-containing protein [Streptomyces sp. NPDC058326]|uniref:DUF5133 domain-containing protein n=1 Tax=Streptomyces sp. NPDC058326 TaxID=3346447 RepID=UPI0036EE1251